MGNLSTIKHPDISVGRRPAEYSEDRSFWRLVENGLTEAHLKPERQETDIVAELYDRDEREARRENAKRDRATDFHRTFPGWKKS